jgi:four helix bundle protein
MRDDVKSYRDLVAWQKSMDLVEMVYLATAQLPSTEQYGLVSQMRRCAVSVPSNIAEGWGRGTRQDYSRFLHMSRGSLYELATQAELCHRLTFAGSWSDLIAATDEVRRILQGLIKSLAERTT